MDRGELEHRFPPGRNVACIGFKGRIMGADAKLIRGAAARHTQDVLAENAFLLVSQSRNKADKTLIYQVAWYTLTIIYHTLSI